MSFNHNLVQAVTLTSLINPYSNTTKVNYQESHPTQFNYPANSNLALLFKQLPQRISINTSSFDSGNQIKNNTYAMQNLLKLINDQFQSKNSIVRAVGVNVSFIADIQQFSNIDTSVDQRISVDLTLKNFVIPTTIDPSHKYIDLNWRAFKINEPITLEYANNQGKNTSKNMDINHLLSILYSLNPDFKNEINSNSIDAQILNGPLIDFSKLSMPMDNWYHLFDPAADLPEIKGYGFKGEANGSKVVTIYSLGEGSIREGKHEDTVNKVIFGNNKQYKSELLLPAPNGRIDILGYSKTVSSAGQDTAIISQTNEGGSSYAGNFPFVVLGGLGAMMAVVVVIVLVKSRKTKDRVED
ncbi:MAG: hypothetical protein M3Z01_06480 [Thermoproteota archaeon]|nr:hypothetical protein [Thermoproteota archaeon]